MGGGRAKRVLVTGASGFIGSRLAAELAERGYAVRAMTRQPGRYTGAGEPVFGDVSDGASLRRALDGVDAAYYLVHALESADFERRDAEAARAFGAAAADAGTERIIYLGGLGVDDGQLSPHLASRREVERLLADGGVPVTVLRAAVVIGDGGISWEITRQLADHLPAMVTPRWVTTRTQPIALPDVIRYLAGVLEPEAARGRVFDIGGPDVLTYLGMLQRAAALMGKRLHNVSVPLLTPGLSSRWLSLVTDVDIATARNLVDSMTSEVVVHDHSIEDVVPGHTLGYDDAVRLALADRAAREPGPRPGRLTRGRLIAAATLVAGMVVLGISLAVPPGDSAFYPLTFLVALIWTAGGLLCGDVRLGQRGGRRPRLRLALQGVLTGVAAGLVFLAGGVIVRQIPFLHAAVEHVLAHARYGSLTLVAASAVLNGIAEEIFFRGGLYAAIGRRRAVAASTLVYAVATTATLNPMLVFASLTLGAVLALQRRATGGILASLATHVTWSLMMLFLLPPLFS